ncbi:hypothetical protein RND81_02G192400 [Saponaria officinalis]|uniref:Uncharacterized protein n=1 Tax=Saponaria officinalis TaxID=3572 RepID=A0AAW1MZ19_SAPOF
MPISHILHLITLSTTVDRWLRTSCRLCWSPEDTVDFLLKLIRDLMICVSFGFIVLQHYIKLTMLEKNRKLNDILDALDFNQVVIFVKIVNSAAKLNKLLVECNFPSICIHSGMSQIALVGLVAGTTFSRTILHTTSVIKICKFVSCVPLLWDFLYDV